MTDHCADCIKGVLHEGNPKGTTQEIAGVTTYVSLPETDGDANKAVVLLGDIFGQYKNAKLICDSFARSLGYKVYFPDYLNGDPVPLPSMNSSTFDRAAWFQNHSPTETRPPLDAVLAHLRSEGVTRIAAAGYCFGGRYTVDLINEGAIEVGMIAHPAGIKVPDDLETLLSKGSAPLLINACEVDHTWPKESQDTAENLLGSGQYRPGFKQNYYPGCTHGFATRGDISVPEIRHGKEDSFAQTVQWFKKYL